MCSGSTNTTLGRGQRVVRRVSCQQCQPRCPTRRQRRARTYRKRSATYWSPPRCVLWRLHTSGERSARSYGGRLTLDQLVGMIATLLTRNDADETNISRCASASHDDTLNFFHKLLHPALSRLFPQCRCLFKQFDAFLAYFWSRLGGHL